MPEDKKSRIMCTKLFMRKNIKHGVINSGLIYQIFLVLNDSKSNAIIHYKGFVEQIELLLSCRLHIP